MKDRYEEVQEKQTARDEGMTAEHEENYAQIKIKCEDIMEEMTKTQTQEQLICVE